MLALLYYFIWTAWQWPSRLCHAAFVVKFLFFIYFISRLWLFLLLNLSFKLTRMTVKYCCQKLKTICIQREILHIWKILCQLTQFFPLFYFQKTVFWQDSTTESGASTTTHDSGYYWTMHRYKKPQNMKECSTANSF